MNIQAQIRMVGRLIEVYAVSAPVIDSGYIIIMDEKPTTCGEIRPGPSKGSVAMATKILLISLVLMLLTACSLLAPVAPNTGQLETSVFETLTALPSLAGPSDTPVVTGTVPAVLPSPTTGAAASTPLPTSTSSGSGQVINPPTAVPVYSPLYPDQFIHYYYNLINQRNYQVTWSLLTDSFKFANNSADQGGFLGYANFWDTVQRVDILGVTINSQSGVNAAVTANMRYNYKNGTVVPSLQPFNLLYDATRRTWLFNSLTPISTPVPVVIAQTPQQFITGYFSSVNAGNLTLGWSLLTDRFKQNVNNNSFDDYSNFWNSVSHVDVSAISLESQAGTNAVINVALVFNYKNGTVTSGTVKYYLIYDTGRSTWLFDSPF